MEEEALANTISLRAEVAVIASWEFVLFGGSLCGSSMSRSFELIYYAGKRWHLLLVVPSLIQDSSTALDPFIGLSRFIPVFPAACGAFQAVLTHRELGWRAGFDGLDVEIRIEKKQQLD